MMWQEFERIAGYSVTYEDYTNVIEPMYMATNLSKQDFVKCLDSKRFSVEYRKNNLKKRLISEMRGLAEIMHDECGRVDTYDTYMELREKAREYIEEFKRFGMTAEFETAKGYGNCTYVKALVWYDEKYSTEVERLELVA